MNNDKRYLWDKSGRPDPFVVEIERLLADKRARVMAAGQRPLHRPNFWQVAGWLGAATAAAVAMWFYFGRDARLTLRPEPPIPPVVVDVEVPTHARPGATRPADADAEGEPSDPGPGPTGKKPDPRGVGGSPASTQK